MRLLFGTILGALITVGAAYVHDTRAHEAGAAQRTVVNWDVLGTSLDTLTARLRSEWTRLAG